MSGLSRAEQERERLDAIAEDFSMRDGFNGYMTKIESRRFWNTVPAAPYWTSRAPIAIWRSSSSVLRQDRLRGRLA